MAWRIALLGLRGKLQSTCSANKQYVDVSCVQGACYLKSQLTTLAEVEHVWTTVQTITNQGPPADSNSLSVTCPSNNPVLYTSTAETLLKALPFHVGQTTTEATSFPSKTDTLQKCVDTSASHPECVSLSYRGVGCYLKSTLTTSVVDPNSGVTGAILVNGPSSSSSTSSTTTTTTTTSSKNTMNIEPS